VKRIILAVIGAAAAAGLTACSTTTPAAAPATHSSARAPVSCSQQYNTWMHGQGKGIIAALHAVSSAATVGDAHVLTATLNRTRPAVSRGARYPVPACADPRGYWDVLLMHVHAAAATKATAASKRAAIKDVPMIERHLTVELQQTTQ
jgi:predicted small secreted protein